jgi:tRNA U34 5-carboxymethylaminomethyl modifying enzyme MnmG/GidA
MVNATRSLDEAAAQRIVAGVEALDAASDVDAVTRELRQASRR